MNKNKVENSILFIIITRAIFLLFLSKLSISDLILGSLLGLLLILIYQKLNLKKYNITKIVSIIVFIILSIAILYNITYYIKDNILKNFSFLMISASFLLISLYIVKKGYHTFIKTIELSSYILIITYITSILLLIPHVKIENFNNFNYFISPNVIEISLLLFFSSIAINYINNYKINYKVYFISITNVVFIKLFITGILSHSLEDVFKYPYISIFKKISYFDFLERLEGFFSLQYLFDYLFLLTLFILAIKFLIMNILKIKVKKAN